MNKFVLIACIASCAQLSSGRPDVSLGYQYNPTQGSSGAGFLQTPVATNNNYFNTAPAFGQTNYLAGSGGSGSGGGFGGGGFGVGSGSGNGGGFGVGSGSGNAGGFGVGSGFTGSSDFTSHYGSSTTSAHSNYNQQVNFAHVAPTITKHFYLHTAPEEHDEQQVVRYLNIGRPQKNYRVVFINTPSSNLGKAKIIANVAPVEDKTAIYVLAKKSNALDLSAEVVTQAPVQSKPDVFFIKYRTPEEAVHAQHTIQAQYDALGGSSDFVNEGSIPVSSAVGSLGDAGSNDSSNIDQTVTIGSGDNTQQTYLPAHHK